MLIWTADGGKFLSMMMAIELEKTVDAGAVVIVFFIDIYTKLVRVIYLKTKQTFSEIVNNISNVSFEKMFHSVLKDWR